MENENQSPSPVESIDQPLQLSHAAGNLQMACIFQPDPNPIRVSPKVGNPTVRDLRVILSRRRMADPVYLSRITITIPVGDDTGPALSVEQLPQPRLVTPGDWSVTTTDSRTVTIKSAMADSQLTFNESSLVFVLPAIRINTEPGIVTVTVKEYESTDDDDPATGKVELKKREAAFPVETSMPTSRS